MNTKKFLDITNTGAWVYEGTIPSNAVCLCESTANIIYEYLDTNSTLIDMGCGVGHYLKYIQKQNKKNINLIGVEPEIRHTVEHFENIVNQDLTKPFTFPSGNVMCLEVLEHIPKEYEKIAVENVVNCCNNYLYISWAKVGQPGDGHVNCKNFEDVVSLFENYGFKLDLNITAKLKSNAKYWWLKNNLCCFRKQ